jgi:hypothetical protein
MHWLLQAVLHMRLLCVRLQAHTWPHLLRPQAHSYLQCPDHRHQPWQVGLLCPHWQLWQFQNTYWHCSAAGQEHACLRAGAPMSTPSPSSQSPTALRGGAPSPSPPASPGVFFWPVYLHAWQVSCTARHCFTTNMSVHACQQARRRPHPAHQVGRPLPRPVRRHLPRQVCPFLLHSIEVGESDIAWH